MLIIVPIFLKIIFRLIINKSMAGKKKFEELMKDAKKMKNLMEQAFRKVDIDGSGYLERG